MQIELLSDTEMNLNCQGICSSSLFFFTRGMSIGRPRHPCYFGIFSLNKNILMMIAILALIHFSLLSVSKIFLDNIYERKFDLKKEKKEFK